MKKRLFLLAGAMFSMITFGGFFDFDEPDKDAYMKKDTPQFKEFTTKIIGEWNIVSLKDGDNAEERMGKYFKSGKATFDFDNNVAKLELILADRVIADNSWKWSEKNRGLDVTEYIMINTSPWKLVWDNANHPKDKPRVLMCWKPVKLSVKAKGDGDIAAFEKDEVSKYVSVQNATEGSIKTEKESGGGMFNMLAMGIGGSLISQTVLGKTDYFYLLDKSGNENELILEGNTMKWGNIVFSR